MNRLQVIGGRLAVLSDIQPREIRLIHLFIHQSIADKIVVIHAADEVCSLTDPAMIHRIIYLCKGWIAIADELFHIEKAVPAEMVVAGSVDVIGRTEQARPDFVRSEIRLNREHERDCTAHKGCAHGSSALFVVEIIALVLVCREDELTGSKEIKPLSVAGKV